MFNQIMTAPFPLSHFILGEGVVCVLSFILIISILTTFTPSEVRHRLFLWGSIASFFSTLFDILSVFNISNYEVVPLWVSTTVSTLFFIFLLLVPLILSNYAYDVAWNGSPVRYHGICINGIIYVFYLIIVFANIKTGWIFKYVPGVGYVRGPLKMITYGLTGVYVFLTLLVVCVNYKSMPKGMFGIFIAYPIICVAVLLVQFFNPRVLLTGTASFATLLMAYISIQSDMLDYDVVSGLMTEHRFIKKLQAYTTEGVVCVVSLDNLYSLQGSMEVSEINKIIIEIGKEYSRLFKRQNAYHLTSNQFAVIGKDMDSIKDRVDEILEFFKELNADKKNSLPFSLEVYAAAVEVKRGDKTFMQFQELINQLLYLAKIEGSHKVKICDDKILDDIIRRRKIYEILNAELRADSEKLQVYFQPIYSLEQQKFTYMEALSRLKNTEFGDISPAEFIPVAESRGLCEKLGVVVLEKVCKFISQNSDIVNAVSVNFSAAQMSNPTVVHTVISMINAYSIKPKNIIIEITESMFIDNFEIVRKNMQELSKLGVRFYLDDFGTGYSNLSNVISLPFSTIKMDRSLVLMMEKSQKNENLFRSLVETFKSAGLNILVEGVETKEQSSMVSSAGADFIQGFLYSKPLPADDCLKVISE